MYACLYRATPQAANLRMTKDNLTPAVALGNNIYTKGLLEIIDECLRMDFMSRPQSVFSLQKSILALPSLEDTKPTFVNKIINVLNKNL
jgi:hypothetical protein